jgi:hypothetical protein
MYLNLDGGNGGEACPSMADSAAVSLSQVSILSNFIVAEKVFGQMSTHKFRTNFPPKTADKFKLND